MGDSDSEEEFYHPVTGVNRAQTLVKYNGVDYEYAIRGMSAAKGNISKFKSAVADIQSELQASEITRERHTELTTWLAHYEGKITRYQARVDAKIAQEESDAAAAAGGGKKAIMAKGPSISGGGGAEDENGGGEDKTGGGGSSVQLSRLQRRQNAAQARAEEEAAIEAAKAAAAAAAGLADYDVKSFLVFLTG